MYDSDSRPTGRERMVSARLFGVPRNRDSLNLPLATRNQPWGYVLELRRMEVSPRNSAVARLKLEYGFKTVRIFFRTHNSQDPLSYQEVSIQSLTTPTGGNLLRFSPGGILNLRLNPLPGYHFSVFWFWFTDTCWLLWLLLWLIQVIIFVSIYYLSSIYPYLLINQSVYWLSNYPSFHQ